MNRIYYQIATKKHEALLELNNPYVTRGKEFDSFDDALAYARQVFAKLYQFQILEIKVIHEENKSN